MATTSTTSARSTAPSLATSRTSDVSSLSSSSVSSSPSRTRSHHHHHQEHSTHSSAVPSFRQWKCLLPVEMPLSQDGELSARGAVHRSSDHFHAVVQDATWLLSQALTSSSPHSSFGGSKTTSSSSTSHSDHASNSSSASSTSPIHKSSAHVAAGGSGAKTRRQVVVQSQRAFALFRLEQFARAVKDYDACLACEPTSALLFYNRGCALYAWGKKDRAIQDFTRALKLDCKNALYVESRALVSKELGRFQEAIQDYAWLETLRRMATSAASSSPVGGRRSHGVTSDDSTGSASVPSTMPTAATMRGSFSMSFSDLQASLLGTAISGNAGNVSTTSLPLASLATAHATSAQREAHVLEWMLRFLQRSPRARTRSDVREAAQFAKTWRFFREMDAAMLEQCLEDATYAFYDRDAVVVEQHARATHFVVVLNGTASFVQNVDVRGSGISKSRELTRLSQGDAVGTDACAASCRDGTLRTIKQEIAASVAAASTPSTGSVVGGGGGGGGGGGAGRGAGVRRGYPRSRGSLLTLLNSHSLVSMLTGSDDDSLLQLDKDDDDDSDDAVDALLPREPASFTSLEPVDCLLLEVESYRDILHDHETRVLEERVAFLRGCRVFQSCSDDVLTALAAVSGARIYDPGKDLLRTGDHVAQLSVIKRGVCQVRKTIRFPATQPTPKPNPKSKGRSRTAPLSPLQRKSDKTSTRPLSSSSSSSSGDGSWVLDNGWMLTNPRLVNTGRGDGTQEPLMIQQDVDVGILASGQVFGELSVLQPGQSSQVTIHSQTLVEILVFEQSDLARLHVQYHSGTMNALQESLLFHNPPQQKILQLQRDLGTWEKQKRGVLRELALQLPGKAQSVIRGAACMASSPSGNGTSVPGALSPMKRRASMVKVPPQVVLLSPLTRHKSIRLIRSSPSLPGLSR